MRRVPRQTVVITDLLGRETGFTVSMPTKEAAANFKAYLNKKELAFYENLDMYEQFGIHLSCDPFRSFEDRFKKKEKA